MSKAPLDTPPSSDHDERRREFLELCGRVGVAVPPTVILLASSGNALASHGRAGHGSGQGYTGGDDWKRRDWHHDTPSETPSDTRPPAGAGAGPGTAGDTISGSSGRGTGWAFGRGGGEPGRGWWLPRLLDRVFGGLFG